jgi:RHS repeat-associated protein
MGFAGSTPQTKGFIGQRLDGESGLMYLHARYYDPQLGRFIQADPSDPTEAGVGVNRYAYALNNPVAYLDQKGLAGIGDNGGPPLIDPMIGEDREFDDEADTGDVVTQQEHELDQRFDRLMAQERRALFAAAGEALMHNAQLARARVPFERTELEAQTGETAVKSRLETVQNLAKEAIEKARSNCRGCVRGNDAHKKFADAIRALKDPHLRAEVSYMRDAQGRLREVRYGTKDADRLDAVEYTDSGAINRVYDLKTGNGTLRSSRVDKISKTLGISKDKIISLDEKDLMKQ